SSTRSRRCVMSDRSRALLALAGALVALPARAQTADTVSPPEPPAPALSSSDVVVTTARGNPNLHVALLQETQARYSVSAEEALYVPVFSANGSYTHTRSPSAVRTGGSLVSTADTYDLNAGLTKQFALGTTVSATVDGTRTVREQPAQISIAGTLVSAPTYT